jgi:hypothetical protein
VILFGSLNDGRRRISISFMEVGYSLWFAFIIFIDGYAGDKRWGVVIWYRRALVGLWDIQGRSIGNANVLRFI